MLSTADKDEFILSRVLPNRSLKYPMVFEKIPIYGKQVSQNPRTNSSLVRQTS